MSSSRLFVLVFALSFWEGRALKCAYKNQTFCGPVKQAYQLNSLSMFFLKGDKFKEDRERLSLANGKVLIVLKKENKSELIPALRNVFDSETNAIFQVKVSCSGGEKETAECQLGITAICLATEHELWMKAKEDSRLHANWENCVANKGLETAKKSRKMLVTCSR
ncbi:hypothetical protein Q1695_003822 [Nippostrongylus brasiliensis]|nr:hypothetical protein Q1695_003822 [Nippostrongylus brasiliensis]